MLTLLEEKDNIGSVSDVDLAGRTITGYIAHFGSVDYGKDLVEPGAFTKTLQEQAGRLRFINHHNFTQPHNFFKVLREDQKGLYFEVEMVKGVSYSMDVLRLYDAGVIYEQSMGYVTVKKEMKSGVRHLKEVRLAEGSNVTVAMNPNAQFTGFKSIWTLERCSKQIDVITKFIRSGNVTDETFQQLELGLKQLQSYSYNLGRQHALEEKGEPAETTHQDDEPQPISIINSFTKSFFQ